MHGKMRRISAVIPVSEQSLNTGLLSRLPARRLWGLSLLASVVLAEFTVALSEWLLKGEVTYDYLLTGLALTLLVSAPIAGILVFFIRRHDLISKHALKDRYLISEAQRIAQIGWWEFDIATQHLRCSPAYCRIFGLSPEPAMAYQSFFERIDPQDHDQMNEVFAQAVQHQFAYAIEYCLHLPDGATHHVIERGETFCDESGRPASIIGTLQDVTHDRLTELEIKRLNRALLMLSTCQACLTRAEDEMQLLSDICRIAVEVGGYRMAWVGYAAEDAFRTIRPMAYFGTGTEYLEQAHISADEAKPEGQGPVGRTLRSGMYVVSADILHDEHFTPWREVARKHGFRGVISLPLRQQDNTFGVLALYSEGICDAQTEELKLLQEMADDLAFGIYNLRARKEQERLQMAVIKIAAGVSGSSADFFEQLALNMTEALEADAGVAARIIGQESLEVHSLAAVAEGKPVRNFKYKLKGTAATELLAKQDTLSYAESGLPVDGSNEILSLNPRVSVARLLADSTGKPLGLLLLLYRTPPSQTDFILSTLRIFATRAAAELERKETDILIQEQASLLDKAQDAIIVRSIDNRILFWNKSAERMYGWPAKEVLGTSIVKLVHDDLSQFNDASRQVLENGEWHGEINQRRRDGSSITTEARWTLVHDHEGRPLSILSINTDITRRKAAEIEIQHLAYYDRLTQLPNRQLLMDRVKKALNVTSRTHQPGALLLIDIDNFKTLNDTLGHDRGDQLLQQVALRLGKHMRQSDTIARFGGDEFAVLLHNLKSDPVSAATQTKHVAEKLLSMFNQPFELDGYEYHCSCSIGVAMFNDELIVVDEVLKRADLAMYQAKASGKNTLRFFDPELQEIINMRAELEMGLRHALQEQQFVLHYQPQVDFEGRITGAEALLRWQRPGRGIVPPMEFIPLAEETGLIVPIGYWVLETACRELARWASNRATSHMELSVNVSARQFRQSDFVERLLGIVGESGADPRKLKLELTESLLVDNLEDTIGKMSALKKSGVGFSLDDFGTGYSSLAYLKRLPLDQLKIDRSFVRDVFVDPNDAAITRTIIALGNSLGLSVIAEGVEAEEQREFLAGHGCHGYQGYLFSKPIPMEQLEDLLQGSEAKPDSPRREVSG